MDFTFKFDLGNQIVFNTNPSAKGIVCGLLVDRCKKPRVLVEWWNKNNVRYVEYFDEDELTLYRMVPDFGKLVPDDNGLRASDET